MSDTYRKPGAIDRGEPVGWPPAPPVDHYRGTTVRGRPGLMPDVAAWEAAQYRRRRNVAIATWAVVVALCFLASLVAVVLIVGA